MRNEIITCDQCNKDMSIGKPGQYAIYLGCFEIPYLSSSIVTLAFNCAPLDRKYEFCSLHCLKKYLENK
jgi:hypothetical protein